MKNYLKKDWPVLFILIFGIAGSIWCVWDLIATLDPFTWSLWRISGIVLIIIGKVIETWVREELKKKVNYTSWISTIELKINQDHKLITNGLFKHVRHPLYSGFILRGLGLGLLSSSVYGSILIFVSLSFLIPRIGIEEDLLTEQFNDDYSAYQKTTKKLVPFLY